MRGKIPTGDIMWLKHMCYSVGKEWVNRLSLNNDPGEKAPPPRLGMVQMVFLTVCIEIIFIGTFCQIYSILTGNPRTGQTGHRWPYFDNHRYMFGIFVFDDRLFHYKLWDELWDACWDGDLEFVRQCIATDRDRGQNLDWVGLMWAAYDNNHIDIVHCIRDSGRVSVYKQLYYSCLLGDLTFVSECIAENKDRGKYVDWERLINAAYGNKHTDIVRYIRDSGRVSLDTQLYASCLLGDREFVSQCIAEDRDRGEDVDWVRLMKTTYTRNSDIAQYILDSERCTLADMTYDDDKNAMMFVVKHTVDVNKEIRPGLNTLHVSAYIGDKDIIKLVLKRGATVNGKGYMGRTALHFLCHGLNTDIDNVIQRKTESKKIKQQPTKKSYLYGGGEIGKEIVASIITIIGKGGDINASDDNGQTPLHLLCLSYGNIDIGIAVLQRGADINKRDNEGRTPLAAAAAAAQESNANFISFLCAFGCDKNLGNFLGQTPLYLAAATNNMSSAEILCAEGVDVNKADEYDVTPLAAACENNYHNIVDLLLHHGADPSIADKEDRTPLHKAVQYGNSESCERLINDNVDLNVQDITGCTPLHLGITENRINTITLLLEAGCSVNIVNNLGNIALHNAAATIKNNIFLTKMLLQKRTNIDRKNNFGHTPAMLSAMALSLKMLIYLHASNANLRLVNSMDMGLIHIVVENYPRVCRSQLFKYLSCMSVIDWLLENGLSINASDVNKQTPLHLAAQQGDLDLVRYLVSRGSDITARDSFNHMPLMNAIESPEVFQYLWEETVPAITEDDFYKLQRLSYWFNISEEMKKQITDQVSSAIELINMPEHVRKLQLRYGDSLEKWLKTEAGELPEFMGNWLPSLQPLTYIEHPQINSVMWKFLKDIKKRVKRIDPLVAYAMTRCGSVEERTKAFAQDECDCSCVLENIRFEMFETPIEADHPVWTAFVHLICKEEYFDHLKRVLDGKKRLSQGKLCHHFGKAIGTVLANSALWAKYPQLQRVSAKDISAGDRRICTMHVIWSDDICPWLKIDIDLAPVIDLSKWKPSWCNKHDLLDEIECIALPKWKMTPKVNMDLMEIGVHSWGPLFHKMPEEMRQGYRLSKVVRGSAVCPQIPQFTGELYAPEARFLGLPEKGQIPNELDEWSNAAEFMNTYLLKQVIMHEYTAWYDQMMDGLDPPVHTDVYWARRIYEKMEEAFKRRELYSWFIPTYNLLTDDKFVQFQDTAVLYARLCRRLLTEEAADHFRKAYLGGS